MASNQNVKELQWVLQELQSPKCNLQTLSFNHHQGYSCCYQETETSINLNIGTNDRETFSRILSSLLETKDDQSSLKNLEFHRVEWEIQQIHDLCSFLDGNPHVRQLAFERNVFNEESLSHLFMMISENNGIKEMTFSECGIGFLGASLLSSSLMKNECLEELQIWGDSIGSKGAEEMSKMVEINTTLKHLIILDLNSITATPLISSVLARNRAMEVHIWSGDGADKSCKIIEFLPGNNTLRAYKIDPMGVRRIVCALGWNSTVVSLDLSGVRFRSRAAKELRLVLEHNRHLKNVNLSKTCLRDKSIVYVAAGLFKNDSLETLQLDANWYSGIGIEHLLCPLSRFSPFQIQANQSLKFLTFGGGKTKIGRDGIAAIVRMIETNQSLIKMSIIEDQSLKPGDFIKIFKSMERNATLKNLSFRGCKGIEDELLLQTIMDTLQVNPWIEDIDLTSTPLQNSGMSEKIYQKLGQNGTMEPEVDTLKDMPLTMPRSCRVFLCGQESAGKSTLSNSLSQSFTSSKIAYLDHLKTLVNPVEQAGKTVGIKIRTLHDGNMKISLWNLVGQHKFYALHDLLFPGNKSPSFFLLIFSLFRKSDDKEMKKSLEIEEDLLYWLRFIVTNSRRAGPQSILPNITLVLTHFDKIIQPSENLLSTVESIQRTRTRFQGYVEFYPTIFTVDARESGSVRKLAHHLRKTSKTILQRAPQLYEVCNDLVPILTEWRLTNNRKPIMKWEEFCDLCQTKVPALRIRSRHDNMSKVDIRRRTIANSLHQVGEVIYFEDFGFIILDCEWFCRDILGQLLKLDVKKPSMTGDKDGFVSRKELDKSLRGSLQGHILGTMGTKILENLEVEDLVKMMLKLELCYEQDPGNPNSLLLVPSILQEERQIQKWQLTTSNCIYVGRHLECDDSSHMFLTPGFFPKLQVHLRNKILGSKIHHGATYTLEKHIIFITINGIYVRVEFGGHFGYYVDILACSTKTINETLSFFQHIIIPTIQSLCNGVILKESVIRPDCIRNLTPSRYRKSQMVPLQRLKEALLSVPAESMYDYKHTWSQVSDQSKIILQVGFDLVRDLLSEEDFRDILHSRYHDLYRLAVELSVPLENIQDSSPITTNGDKVDPTLVGIAQGVETVLQRLKIIQQEIMDLKQEIQGLKYYEYRLLVELHRKLDYLVNFSVQLEERKLPNLFYFVQEENHSKRLVTNMIPGMKTMQLHMLCEFRRQIHVIEDQIGCQLMQVDNRVVICLLPYMSKLMKLLTFTLKIGAHVAVGMGGLIPDLSKEVTHLMDNSLLYGSAALAIGTVGLVAAGQAETARNRNRNRSGESSRSVQQDLVAAQQWLAEFLKNQRCTTGKEIAERFGLWRVRYRDDGQVAWICKWHRETRSNEVTELPF